MFINICAIRKLICYKIKDVLIVFHRKEAEIQKYLDIEEKQKVLTTKPATKKQWWKFWN